MQYNYNQPILLIDDDIQYADLVKTVFEIQGYILTVVHTGKEGIDLVKQNSFLIIMLDINLPDIDGFTLCRQIRQISSAPIIIITSRVGLEDKVEGFMAGADDYLVKPYFTRELILRVEAILRRINHPITNNCSGQILRINGIKIDLHRGKLVQNEKSIYLSPTENRILQFFVNNRNRIITVDEIMKEIWDENWSQSKDIVRVNISRLRHKLNNSNMKNNCIEAVPGEGYVFRIE